MTNNEISKNLLSSLDNLRTRASLIVESRDRAIKELADFKQGQNKPFERNESLIKDIQAFAELNLSKVTLNELIFDLFEWLDNKELANFIGSVFDSHCIEVSECCEATIKYGMCTKCLEHSDPKYIEV